MSSNRFGYYSKLILLFAVYFITARLGLSLDAVSGFATLVWPPTGIALAAMIILGYRYWPAIAAGAFLVNLVAGAPVFVALGISVGNTFEALLGAYLLIRFTKVHVSLDHVRDVLGMIFFAAIVSTLVSATIGTTSLKLGGVLSTSFGEAWVAWWVGDMLGAIVVAPLLLVWNARLRSPVEKRRLFKATAPVLLLAGASVFAFHGLPWIGIKPFAFAYIVFPSLVWMSLRYGQLGSTTATFIVAVIAVWGTVATHSINIDSTLSHDLLLLQSFIGITAATFLIVAAVVTEREETQKKEHALSQKTAHLIKQRARLQALNEAKDDFISIASHQLRTPATGVKQYLGMLLESYAGKLTGQQRSYAELAYENNERQLKTINDLLRVASLDAGKLSLEKSKCDIAKLASDIVKQQSEAFEKRNQKLSFSSSKKQIHAHVDKTFLRMVLENIIDNAGKYSPESGKVKVKVSHTNKHVHLHISDNGFGIAKKDHQKLFQKFSRLDNTSSGPVGGSGLGLYWAKKVIDLHGGTIKLNSELNKGSTFIIGLPLNAEKIPLDD